MNIWFQGVYLLSFTSFFKLNVSKGKKSSPGYQERTGELIRIRKGGSYKPPRAWPNRIFPRRATPQVKVGWRWDLVIRGRGIRILDDKPRIWRAKSATAVWGTLFATFRHYRSPGRVLSTKIRIPRPLFSTATTSLDFHPAPRAEEIT